MAIKSEEKVLAIISPEVFFSIQERGSAMSRTWKKRLLAILIASLVVLFTLAGVCVPGNEDDDDDDDDDNDDNDNNDDNSPPEEAVCGDGVVTGPDEECEEDTDCPDGFCEECKCEGFCGDGVVVGSEECEQGVDDPGCEAGEECIECHCVEDAVCGDGVITYPEDCEYADDCPGNEICVDCFCEPPEDNLLPVGSTGGLYQAGDAPSPTGDEDLTADVLSLEELVNPPGDCPSYPAWSAVCGTQGDPFHGILDYLVAKMAAKGQWAGAVYVTVDGFDGYLEITTFYDEIQSTPTLFQVWVDMYISDDAQTGDYTMSFAMSPADNSGNPDYTKVSEYLSAPLYIR